jgi:hypothetical protein
MIRPRPPGNPPSSPNLRAELLRAGVSQADVARILRTTQPNVSQKMRTGNWRPGDLAAIAAYLQLPLHKIQDDPVPPGRVPGRYPVRLS